MSPFGKKRTVAYKKAPFTMKGYSYPGAAPKKVEDKKVIIEESNASELLPDTSVEQGYQPTKTSGVQQFASVKKLIDAGAPKEIIEKERLKQMKLFKESKAKA